MLQNITLFGQSISLYSFFNNASYFGMLLVALFLFKEFTAAATLPKLVNIYLDEKKKSTLFLQRGFIAMLGAVFVFVSATINSLACVPISKLFLGTTDGNFFPNIFICPITVFLLSVLLRNLPLITMDESALLNAIALVFYKIACFCKGCCNGVAWEHGLMNQDTGRKEFPIQLVEIACAVVMFTILMSLFRKKKYKVGILYPLFMLMYCGSRFISEFWRDDYPDVWGPFKAYHLQCVIGFVEGAIFLFIVLKWGERITAYFEEKNQAFLDRHTERVKEKRRQARANKAPKNKKKKR